MASMLVSEKLVCVNNDDECFKEIGVSEISGAFLMSLMEDLQDQVEESDEERLKCVIQSLEAEINSATNHHQCSESDHHQSVNDDVEDSQLFSVDQMGGDDCTVSFDDLDVHGWIDMETMNPYIYPLEDEIMGSVVFGESVISTTNYCCQDNYYNEVSVDQDHGSYSSLWQEIEYDDSLMYD